MRILHVIDELKLGGAGTHLATMVEHTTRHFPEIQHRTLSLFEGGTLGARLERAGCSVGGVDVRRDVLCHRYGRAVGALEREVAAFCPDVVEAHLTWSRFLALRAASRQGVPVRIGYEQGDIYMRSPRIRAANFVLQLDAQRIVVCSSALRRWAHRTHGIAWERLVVMHNSIDTARFTAAGPKRSERFGFSPSTVVFVAVGTLGTGVNKRVDVCIDAILRCCAVGHDVGLVVCGDGPQRAELEARVARSATPHAVVFLGAREDVPEILACCDAFCHAAPFEPFGIVCVEAMAAGLPVVVPDGGGIHEAVEDGVTGFVYRALDVADMADKVARLAADQQLRGNMGAAGKALAVRRFDIADYMSRLLGMYGSLLASRAA